MTDAIDWFEGDRKGYNLFLVPFPSVEENLLESLLEAITRLTYKYYMMVVTHLMAFM